MPLRHFAPAKSASRLLPQPGGFEGSRGLRKKPQSRQAPVPKLEHPGDTGAQARASKGAKSAV
jgi:hypothetical protein